MNGKAMGGVALLAIFLAAVVGGVVVGDLDYYAEDPRAEEDSWNEEAFHTAAHASVPSRIGSCDFSSGPSYMPEPRDQSRLFLLELSLRC